MAAGFPRATQPYQRTLGVSIPFGASLSYVPGGHSFKFGFYNVTAQRTSNVGDNVAHLTYQFLNGTPNQLTQRRDAALPGRTSADGISASSRRTNGRWNG